MRCEGDWLVLRLKLRMPRVWERRWAGLLGGKLRWDSAYNVGWKRTEVVVEPQLEGKVH